MRFESTRDAKHVASLGTAVQRGLAPDGGLYVPERLPAADTDALANARALPELAARLLSPFAEGDDLVSVLRDVAADAFDFAAPVVDLTSAPEPLSVLELFHGPTAAFKDFGARFLAATLERLPRDAGRRCTMLVATSGDTGGAVASAFHGRPWVDVVVLYPRGLVSARQRQQLACWGGNVTTLAVSGTFDDCQALVKGAFAGPGPREGARAVFGEQHQRRPPAAADGVLRIREPCARSARSADRRASSFRPATSGNALRLHLGAGDGPADRRHRAGVQRQSYDPRLHRQRDRGRPRPSVATLASAMDVGNPSNLERLRWLDPGSRVAARVRLDAWVGGRRGDPRYDPPRLARARAMRGARIRPRPPASTGGLPAARRAGRWVIVATAHPAKFDEIVEPLIGARLPIPVSLAAILARPPVERQIAARPGRTTRSVAGVPVNTFAGSARLALGSLRRRSPSRHWSSSASGSSGCSARAARSTT